MSITNRKLEIFALVAELGSISRAAAKLRLAQPVVSRAVSTLERNLGVKLCERLPKGISLTGAGSLLARDAREILDRIEQLEERVRDEVSSPSGRIHLGISPSIAPILAPQLILRLKSAFPRMLPILHEINSLEAWGLMQSGKLDLCVMSSMEPDHDIEMDFLANEPVCLIGPKTPELSGRRQVDLGFVASLPLILTSRPHVLRRLLDAQFSRMQLKPTVVAETDSLISIRMALSGLGYTVFGSSGTYAFRSEHSISIIPISGLRITWVLAYSKSRASTKTRLICARIIRELANEAIRRGDWHAKLVRR